ncbi:MAG TPA: RdgB/HAM1 family non-canonical purine NTP pyrophosphatase [Pyrinomonadaceae bacterium]|jgi:XTP/dITP diphosphohydrolase
MSKLIIGTCNRGKLSEIKTILGDVFYELMSLADFVDVDPPEENGLSYADNAIIKAQRYATHTGLLTLADDSGLEVEALGWAPGVFSARYAGEGASDEDRRALLLSELAKSELESRKAKFVCAVAIADSQGQIVNVSEGVCWGRINNRARGQVGFGYDPLFVPDGYTQTFAELPEPVKNVISHRGRALAKTREFLLSHKV